MTVVESNKLTNVILDGEYDMFHWGWYMEPDPDSILDVFTCGQRGNSSDSWYCNPKYDALMAQQKQEVDDDKRVETIKQMQQLLFEESPYLVLALHERRTGLPQRPVRLLRAAAQARRRAADAVRLLQLQAGPPDQGCGRL